MHASFDNADTHILHGGHEHPSEISAERIVRRNGKVIRRDTFTSNYIAESQLFVVGPQFSPDDGGTVESAPPEFQF